jgi:hypothetical protein
VIAPFFHAWERRLASIDANRIVRPFDWGLDWLELDAAAGNPAAQLTAWSAQTMADTDAFFRTTAADAYERRENVLTFPSAVATPHAENNLVRARIFPAPDRPDRPRRAVIVLP